jgi:hypothetical protein
MEGNFQDGPEDLESLSQIRPVENVKRTFFPVVTETDLNMLMPYF